MTTQQPKRPMSEAEQALREGLDWWIESAREWRRLGNPTESRRAYRMAAWYRARAERRAEQ